MTPSTPQLKQHSLADSTVQEILKPNTSKPGIIFWLVFTSCFFSGNFKHWLPLAHWNVNTRDEQP